MATTKSVQQGIYKIVNVQNDYFYIGSAVDLRRRNNRHFSELRTNKHNNKHLQAAWNKYGEVSFKFAIVELVAKREDLYTAEDRWLAGHVGKSYCYNMGQAALSPMLGLCGVLSPTWGYKHTPEAIAKITAASTGRPVSEETRLKRSTALKGHVVTEAQRLQISATLSGEGNFWYGKTRPDHGAKVSKAVAVTNPAGVETVYESIQALREALQLNPPTVNRALKSGKALTRGPYAGWVFKYHCTV